MSVARAKCWSERRVPQNEIGRRVAAGLNRDDRQKAEYSEQNEGRRDGTIRSKANYSVIGDAEQQIAHEGGRGENRRELIEIGEQRPFWGCCRRQSCLIRVNRFAPCLTVVNPLDSIEKGG